VKQEPSDKFICLERHGLFTAIVGIISPEKRNIAIPVGQDTIIADGDPVGISAEILKHPLGATKGRFAIDDPLLVIEPLSEGFEDAWLFEMTDTARKDESTSFEALFEMIQKLAAEYRRHDLYMNKETLFR
jgi:hypothetical protein